VAISLWFNDELADATIDDVAVQLNQIKERPKINVSTTAHQAQPHAHLLTTPLGL
jgi:hypothetical protein